MGAGHKEKITTASDVMSGLRLSLSRRRTIELGLAVGMAFSAPGVRGDLSGRGGIKIRGGEAAVNLPLFRALQAHIPGSRFVETNWASDFGGSRRHTQRILPKFAARASTLRRWTCSTEQSAPRIM